jgi:flagellar protein FliJ
MKKKSQRIKAIVDIKAMQEKTALEVLGATQRKLVAMQDQVDGLIIYRQEYRDRFNQLGAGGSSISKLLEFRSFMDKLDKAIAEQELILIEYEAEVITKRKLWKDLHHRTQSLQKVCDSALYEELKQEYKQEQLAQDEHASRLASRLL